MYFIYDFLYKKKIYKIVKYLNLNLIFFIINKIFKFEFNFFIIYKIFKFNFFIINKIFEFNFFIINKIYIKI